jgi:uncharacterized Fe-S cluster-containing MiaB family protein
MKLKINEATIDKGISGNNVAKKLKNAVTTNRRMKPMISMKMLLVSGDPEASPETPMKR